VLFDDEKGLTNDGDFYIPADPIIFHVSVGILEDGTDYG
jgi:hypothetical protein